MTLTLEEMQRRDAADPFAALRDAFDLPPGETYLDGNSLGALPHATAARLAATVREEWGKGLIRSWNKADWIGAPARLGGKIARIIGAAPHEVLVADSTSVNLYKLLVAAVQAQSGRRVILSEPGNFPTDLYVAQGVAATLPDCELRTVPRDRIIDAIDESVAVVMLTHVHYQSGARFDMDTVTRAAQAKGALILWDLSHSAGAVPVDLNAANADLAVGCGYKYLNGGPGAPAFLFVAERHQAVLRSPLSGWMGHAAPFEFSDEYAPGDGIRRFLCGTPPILGIAALEEGIDLFLSVDRPALFAKGQALCSAFIDLVEDRCAGLGLGLLTTRDAAVRGSHVSLRHANAWPVMQALIARGVIGDFRAPDALRFGFTPLYTSYCDVWHAVDMLHDILASGSWDQPDFHVRAAVT
ncbi:kynureninase [Sphingomonas sp.]|uniref:kynureninase n=1 Tax=Sphingomonas sp. TaxID=28214 RepID=UPI003D6C8FAD